MKRFQKKMYLICTMALICAGVACFSGCSTDFWTLDDVATTSSTFYILGYIDGIGQGVENSEVEFKSKNLINEWWNGLSVVKWCKGIFGDDDVSETEGTDGETETENNNQDQSGQE